MDEIYKQLLISIAVLNEKEKQVLKDAIKHGAIGPGRGDFIDEEGDIVSDDMCSYCPIDARFAGNFAAQQIPALFRSIYRKLCINMDHSIGRVLSHAADWWEMACGDSFFIRREYVDSFEIWART